MKHSVFAVVCFLAFVAAPVYASNGTHDNKHVGDKDRPTISPPSPATRKLALTNAPTKPSIIGAIPIPVIPFPQRVTLTPLPGLVTSAPAPPSTIVAINPTDPPVGISTDPFARTNPRVTKSGSTCGTMGKPSCHLTAGAKELGDPKSGTDCSNYEALAFYDPNGKCYLCLIGYDRTLNAVTSDAACANTVMDWITDREQVGLFNMAMTEEVVQKVTTDEMRAIYDAAYHVQPSANSSLVYDLKYNSAQSVLLREATKYHLLAYATKGQINPSDPEYTALRWMAEYIRYYRIYLANEASKMMNAWLEYQEYLNSHIPLPLLNLAPPFPALVANAYLFGNNGGAVALAVVASTLILTSVVLLVEVQLAFGLPTAGLFAASSIFAVPVFVDGVLGTASVFSVAATFTGPATAVLIGILIAIQGILTVVHNSEVEDAVHQGVVDANKPYDVNMLIAALQSNSTVEVSEFLMVFSVAAAGKSKASLAKTNTAVSMFVNDLCNFAGPFSYNNNTQLCPTPNPTALSTAKTQPTQKPSLRKRMF